MMRRDDVTVGRVAALNPKITNRQNGQTEQPKNKLQLVARPHFAGTAVVVGCVRSSHTHQMLFFFHHV